MAKPARKNEIIRKIALDEGLTKQQVEEAVNSQFRFAHRVMASNTFAQVRLPFFGRFWVKPARLKFLQKFGKRIPDQEDD